MKILIQSTNGGAHKFTNLGLARAFNAIGYESFLWEDERKSVFDLFDEIQPDIFLGQTYNLTSALIKCIQERPTLKVGLRASDNSKFSRDIAKKYPVLVTTEEEIKNVNLLRDLTGKPHFLHNHYTQKSIEKTHEDWIKDGFNVKSSLLAADLFDFHGGKFKKEFETDICFVGGYLPLKTPSINNNLMPILSENKYRARIFGSMAWPTHYYMGYAPDSEVKNLLSSAKVCPCLSEIHSLEWGHDIIERYFKLGSNKCLCVADYVKDAVELFPDIIHCKNPEEFKYQIDYWINKEWNDPERIKKITNHYNLIMGKHTYFDRAIEILQYLNINTNNININKIKGLFDEDCNNWI